MGFIYDTGNGELRDIITQKYVGDIIYPQGIVVITSGSLINDLTGSYNSVSSSYGWSSNLQTQTFNFTTRLRDYEFNFTQNPSAQVSGSKGILKDNVTGSYFQPYITGIGLYNDTNELLAVAKLGTPIPKSSNTDMTLVIKLDY